MNSRDALYRREMAAAIADAEFTSEQRYLVRMIWDGETPWWTGWQDRQLEREGVIVGSLGQAPHTVAHFERWGRFALARARIAALLRDPFIRERIVHVPLRRRPIPASVRRVVLERDGYRCVRCGRPEPLELDHIYPHARGGSDHPDNLQALCGRCNRTKGAALPAQPQEG